MSEDRVTRFALVELSLPELRAVTITLERFTDLPVASPLASARRKLRGALVAYEPELKADAQMLRRYAGSGIRGQSRKAGSPR